MFWTKECDYDTAMASRTAHIGAIYAGMRVTILRVADDPGGAITCSVIKIRIESGMLSLMKVTCDADQN